MQQAPVRTFHARAGRLSALTRSRLQDLQARYAVPPGLLAGPVDDGHGVVLDVGCGHGASTLAFAAAYPHRRVVGVDVYPLGIARLLAAVESAGLTNVYVHRGDAVPLLGEVAPGRVSAVHLFFPDPWPKARHRKRRFVSEGTLRLLYRALRPQGQVLLATDRLDYADHVRAQVHAHGGFRVHEVARPPWRPVAGFEAAALAAGRAVTDLRLDRVSCG